jgi:hypothetical protein
MLIDVAKPLQYIVGIITLFVRNLHFPGFLKHERVEAVASKIAPAAWLTTATIPLLFGGERRCGARNVDNSRLGTIGAHHAGLPPVSLPLWEAV